MWFLGQISGHPHASCIQQEKKKSWIILKNKCVTNTPIYSVWFYYFTFCYFSHGIINVYAWHCNIHWQSSDAVANVRHSSYTLQMKIVESKRWDVVTRCTIKKSVIWFVGFLHSATTPPLRLSRNHWIKNYRIRCRLVSCNDQW